MIASVPDLCILFTYNKELSILKGCQNSKYCPIPGLRHHIKTTTPVNYDCTTLRFTTSRYKCDVLPIFRIVSINV